MRAKSIILLAFFLPSACLADWPPSIDFYTDGVIGPNDTYAVVRTFDIATVDMTGGLIKTYLELYDTSTFNAYGGMMEGYDIVLYDSSTLNLRGLSQVGGNRLRASTTTANINVYGSGFEYDSSWLTGYWASGESFAFHIRDDYTYACLHLHEIPEPSTLALLLLGVFAVVKRNR